MKEVAYYKSESMDELIKVEDMPKSIKSNFELDPDIYTGGESK